MALPEALLVGTGYITVAGVAEILMPEASENGASVPSRSAGSEADLLGQIRDVPIAYPAATPPARTSQVAVVHHPGLFQRLLRIETRSDWLPIPLCPLRFIAHGDPLSIAQPIRIFTRAAIYAALVA